MGRKARYICIRSSLAMGIHRAHWHTYVGAYNSSVRGGGGEERKL